MNEYPPIAGRVAWVFREDNFDIDQIIGVANIKLQDPAALAAVAMQRFDVNFRNFVRAGDILVAGRNFGYGHPHYSAMKAMRFLGIAAVIAESFFPPYRRGELNLGFPQIVCPGIVAAVQRGDELRVDWAGAMVQVSGGRSLPFAPLSLREMDILTARGFKSWLKRSQA